MKRFALVSGTEPSFWGSCKIITPNLETAYNKLLGPGTKKFNYNRTLTPSQIFELAREIKKFDPSKLIFVDHLPHPYPLIEALRHLGGPLPELYFHLYGDFTLFIKDWLRTESLIKNQPVTWIVASQRQGQLVRTLTKSGSVQVCPFPVRESVFSYKNSIRSQFRKKMGLRSSDKVIIYTGRISLQKNVLSLIENVSEYIVKTKRTDIHLWIAGDFDNLGAPLFGIQSKDDVTVAEWERLMDRLPEVSRNRIRYLGVKKNEDLVQLYCAADLYLSLSTHHDEDYGMAPAEALMCGCPALLTGWGGYAGFSHPNACNLVDVRIGKTGLKISSNKIQSQLDSALNQIPDRESIAKYYRERFSVGGIEKTLKAIVGKSPDLFRGFSAVAEQWGRRIRLQNPFGKQFGPESLYFKIYKNYTEDYGKNI